ncbi:hypothetical protein [Collimonas pratensis]|uniref:HEAT repeat domain-containing protein n=1 Tax=Collimonas pratensis TaxID=279113 RepID=A0A127PXF5_9BURK|nr:hypothetical protein [Collimonas pratensis]AMP02498.1 hypothetical protein CPter91_0099 [Collimonas pratensis]AMP12399.1 hypothetical protein CPter291_0103 [Collimonas pratensis]
MTNALVVKAANLIRNGDIAGAEFALVSLAETEGDYALVAALETLPPKDLLAVIREYDTSKESVVNLVVTPEQFARAVVMERLYGDHSHVRLRGMINAVLFRDDSHTGEFIEAIGEVDGGCEALIDYLSDRDEEVVHFVTYDTFNVNRMEEGDEVDKAEISDRDWKELTWLLKHEHADMFEQIWPVLKKRMKERLRREAEQELLEQQAQEPQERRERPAAGAAPAAIADSGEESAL